MSAKWDLILIVFVLAAGWAKAGDTSFDENTISTDPDGACSVFAADLDNDGDMDVLSASYNDNTIVWCENLDGVGTFGEEVVITTNAAGARAVFAADLDDDGDIDVISASENDDKVAWFENTNGAGLFGPERLIGTSVTDPGTVFVSDVDNDGLLDVIAACSTHSSGQKIAWFKNLGAGSFDAERVVTTNAYSCMSVFAADLDKDGDTDILAALHHPEEIIWCENVDGAGTFGNPIVITTLANGAHSVSAADIDNDGDLDVISASEYDNKIAWYTNNDGLGSFGPQLVISTAVDEPRTVFAADIDNDGDLDVLSGSRRDCKVAWYENTDGAGSFGTQNVITTNAVYARSVFAIDIDGDGDTDVLSASEGDDKVAFYRNTDGSGLFGEQELVFPGVDTTQAVICIDIDGDTDLDILSASQGVIAWYENIDTIGNYGKQRVISTEVGYSRSVFPADIDGDGDIDVLSASRDDINAVSKIAWYENTDGMGVFGPQQIINTDNNGAHAVYSADINGDGYADVITASYGDDKIAWHQNLDGLGTFGPQLVITTNAEKAGHVGAADIDGDGHIDVFSSSYNKLAWYQNTDGAGTFGPQRIIDTLGDDSVDILAVDIDGDGDLDICSKRGWFANLDGLGTFGALNSIDFTGYVYPHAVNVADMDGDGDVDMLYSLYHHGSKWYENTDGAGTFGNERAIGLESNKAYSISVGDLDGDGWQDVVLGCYEDVDKIIWYKNHEGQFSPDPPPVNTNKSEGGCLPNGARPRPGLAFICVTVMVAAISRQRRWHRPCGM